MTLHAVTPGSLPGKDSQRRQSLMVAGLKSVPGYKALSSSRKNMEDPKVGLPKPKTV